jgi:pyruvate dehydrogenase (quinone)
MEARAPQSGAVLAPSATGPGDLRGAIERALAADGPAIIDCAVAPNEMPNFPHVEVGQAKHYVVAKIKGAMLSFVDR